MRLLSLVLLLGCVGSTDDDKTDDVSDPDGTDTTDPTDDTTDPNDPSISGLGDVFEQISGDDPDCELVTISTGERCPGVEGATSFMVVDVEISGDDVTGKFSKIYFSNEWWFEDDDWIGSRAGQAGKDWCEVIWDLNGTIIHEGNPEYCAFCEHELLYDLNRDNAASDCPEGLITDGPAMIEGAGWDIDEKDGGIVGYDTEREIFPHGRISATGVLMWSDGVCEYYGSQQVGEGDCLPAE
jgi:hypothetical protein